jgi:hypothetical protein
MIDAVEQERLFAFLEEQGYQCLKILNGKICGLNGYLFTTGIVVGLTELGLERRYCFARVEDAIASFDKWDGVGHPPGNWIKMKGLYEGSFQEIHGPNPFYG